MDRWANYNTTLLRTLGDIRVYDLTWRFNGIVASRYTTFNQARTLHPYCHAHNQQLMPNYAPPSISWEFETSTP